MVSTLYLEGNFLPDFWKKPNLFYQKLSASKSKVILISDSVNSDLTSWLKSCQPNLEYQHFNVNTALEYLSNKEHLANLKYFNLFIEDRDGSIPKEIYIKSLNSLPKKAFVLARWIDWVGSSKSTLTAAFTSLSVTKSVINHPSELYQFVDLFPKSEPFVLAWQDEIHNVPMGAYYIFNQGNENLNPFSVFDSNQKSMITQISTIKSSKKETSPDLKDLFLALERIEQIVEGSRSQEDQAIQPKEEQINQMFLELKHMLEKHFLLEFGFSQPNNDNFEPIEFKDLNSIIYPEKEKVEPKNQEVLDMSKVPPETVSDITSEEKTTNPIAKIWAGMPRTSPESNGAED